MMTDTSVTLRIAWSAFRQVDMPSLNENWGWDPRGLSLYRCLHKESPSQNILKSDFPWAMKAP
jgi:hypothetical protein